MLGPNGAGKTTLLRMLFGLVTPDAGSIELFGRPLRCADPRPWTESPGSSRSPSFYPYLSGRANLELLAELDGRDAGRRIDGVLEQVDLLGRARDNVSGYSSGMRQRLGLAAALLREPRLLLLDEPTSGLDPAGARTVGTLLRELASRGTAVLLSSHLIGEIEGTCDGFTVVARGRVVWSGSAAQLRAQAPPSAFSLVTSDDDRALAVAESRARVRAGRARTGELEVEIQESELDAFVLALGQAGVAVRRLELRSSPLESMFFALTADAADATDATDAPDQRPARRPADEPVPSHA